MFMATRQSPTRRMSSSALPASAAGRLWTPQTEALARELAVASPAGLAYVHGGALGEEHNPAVSWIPAEHLLLIADRVCALVRRIEAVQAAIAGGELPEDAQGPRLMVFMPPRHGKSELISKYTPAWFLGTHPELRIILTGYGTQFAGTWGRKARDLLEEVGEDVYDVAVSSRSGKADDWELEGKRGGMKTAGVGGSITGMGAHLFVVDDPVKSAEEARSEVMQLKTWEWWRETARTRFMPGAGAIVLQTRWHELDLSGHLLANDPTRDRQGRLLPDGERRQDVDGEQWDVLCLPAISREDGTDGYGQPDELARTGTYITREIPATPERDAHTRQEWQGEPLWPAFYPLAQLEILKRALGRYGFGAQFQQTPTPDEGGIFQRKDFRYLRTEGAGDMLTYVLLDEHMQPVKRLGKAYVYEFMTVDPALSEKETADYTVVARWAVSPDRDLLLLDLERHHFEQPDVKGFIIRTKAAWGITDLRVEAKAAGLALVQTLTREGHAVRQLEADVDKVTRAMGAAPRYEAHTVYHLLGAPWLEDYERELLAFPNGAHDDQVDVFAYAALALPGIPIGLARKREQKVKTHTGGLLNADL